MTNVHMHRLGLELPGIATSVRDRIPTSGASRRSHVLEKLKLNQGNTNSARPSSLADTHHSNRIMRTNKTCPIPPADCYPTKTLISPETLP